MDNEAGLENLSRRIIQKVDLLIFVTDPSRQGLTTVKRLYDLAQEMNVQYKNLAIIANRFPDEKLIVQADELKNSIGANWVISLSENAELAELSRNGKGVLPISLNNPVVKQLDQFLKDVGIRRSN